MIVVCSLQSELCSLADTVFERSRVTPSWVVRQHGEQTNGGVR